MLAITVDNFQSNWTQQLPYVMMFFLSSVHYLSGYKTQFFVFGEENHLPIVFQNPSPKKPGKTDQHQIVQQQSFDTQRAREAARLHHQAAQLRCNAIYIFITHSPDISYVTVYGYKTPSTPKD